MQQPRSFLTTFMQDHLDKLDLSDLFTEYRASEFSPDRFHLGIGEIAGITDAATWQALMQVFYSQPQLVAHTTIVFGDPRRASGQSDDRRAYRATPGAPRIQRPKRAHLRWRAQCHPRRDSRLRHAPGLAV